MKPSILLALAASVSAVWACDSCYGPSSDVVHERLVRRMQPGAKNAIASPKGPLEWGQLNFIHTTDTHGWLEGHLKEQNYGADWGDFVSFSKHMKNKATNLGVDLLLIDTGDLHDGNGLSDSVLPNGVLSNPIFDNIDYDILTIGNHELYVSEIAYEHFYSFSKVWGEKYLTSNVQILNPASGQFEYIGAKYRYFTTQNGLCVMAFGVLFDFTGNSNVSKVIKAADMVKQQWFLDAVNHDSVDLFLLTGHNPVRRTNSASTFGLLHDTIRSLRPGIPIQGFGGHTHIRDFEVYDESSTALESGRYCETLGWLSMSGINPTAYKGVHNPHGVLNPSQKAVNSSTNGLTYSRRYLDWNRLTFSYHASSSQPSPFDTHSGLRVTSDISSVRKQENLAFLYGCAPATYCLTCQPFGAPGNIFFLTAPALAATVVNPSRATVPRYILLNTGSIRFDLVQGPFTYDDSFIVSPFNNLFQYIPNVPYPLAKNVLTSLNGATSVDKRYFDSRFAFNMSEIQGSCVDPDISYKSSSTKRGGITRRQTVITPGYTTTDDFGTDGDDTPHSTIPDYYQPNYAQANASFPTDGSEPEVVDVGFLDFFGTNVVQVLNALGGSYGLSDIGQYMEKSFTAQSYLPKYAQIAWQENIDNCLVEKGVGFSK